MKLRGYQDRVLNSIYEWWMRHPSVEDVGVAVMPTGSGKSVVIAELVRLLFDTWPEDHPRTLVIVPSKELAEQNAEKLAHFLPSHLSIGYYSASLGRKIPNADVIVATIGSIYKDAHLLGNIKCVVVDECHLISPDSAGTGRYRQFLTSLAKYCTFRVVGFTATPFRGNGVFLTCGEDPLFTGIAATVSVQELLDDGFLAPLVRPIDVLETHIDMDGVSVTGGDYNMLEMSRRVDGVLVSAAKEAALVAKDRKKWIAFLPTVVNALHFVDLLNAEGIHAVLVCGETPKAERTALIADFRAGRVRCLVTVLALAIGFDVPDVDCIIWLRPTISPVLFVQGLGRGMRIAPGKLNCLYLDFSGTVDRLGPVDLIKGRKKRKKSDDDDHTAPYKICDNCGERNPPRVTECTSCGYVFPPKEDEEAKKASNAAVMAHQVSVKIVDYEVSRVEYALHKKEGKPDSLRVEYYDGLRRVASEWVCFEHSGFARAKAEGWWRKRVDVFAAQRIPANTAEALDYWHQNNRPEQEAWREPVAIRVNETGKFAEIIGYSWA